MPDLADAGLPVGVLPLDGARLERQGLSHHASRTERPFAAGRPGWRSWPARVRICVVTQDALKTFASRVFHMCREDRWHDGQAGATMEVSGSRELTARHVAWDAWRATRSGPAAIAARQAARLQALVQHAPLASRFYAERYRAVPPGPIGPEAFYKLPPSANRS
jgi:hypothetical protein